MNSNDQHDELFALGQKLAFAKAALLLGIASFVSLLGMEKGILAIAFAALALRASPHPRLVDHRRWAWIGLSLGILVLLVVPVVLIINQETLVKIIELLEELK